ncbi:MAG TPA: hypothetical protein VKW06_13650 [Candidatus Angelobacter sp.]|nr:hypothetical protein [Candidatus Angelobacter sp.]
MKKIKRVTEAEVIAEFLKGEYYHPEYNRDRGFFEALVYDPHLTDPVENALRRALLFRRRGTMWRELPPDTHWWEVELDPEDVDRITVFPRAQWRSVARGNFRAIHVAELLRRGEDQKKPGDLAFKITSLRNLMSNDGPRTTILLIGTDETQPITLLEGNHRFVASLLLPQEIMLRRLRLVCGFSPDMDLCCWYKTNLPNLAHYLKNRIKHYWDREADVTQLLPKTARVQSVGSYPEQADLSSAKPD